jgi:hypothetical protein
MPTERNPRRLALLAGLLLVLAGIVTASVVRRQTAVDPASSSKPATASSGEHGNQPTAAKGTEAVNLEALTMPRPDPVEGERDPFRFRTRPTPSPRPTPTGGRAAGPGPTAAPPVVAQPAPTGPPIPLKFIGIVDAPKQGGKLAVLSDGRSVLYGHEGEVIDGRFKILRIGVESIELSHVDGRGRQTIRLTGQ